MKLQLNIGLARNDGLHDNSVLDVIAALNKHSIKLKDAELKYVGETTFVSTYYIAKIKPIPGLFPALVDVLEDLSIDRLHVGYQQGKHRVVQEVSRDSIEPPECFFWLE